MRIALELHLKRLIVGGLDRVYEIGRVFRNEGIDIKHNPEFTMLEIYQAFTDYQGMMDLLENLVKNVCEEVLGSTTVTYQGESLDFSHWERMTMVEAVKKYSGIDYYEYETSEAMIAAINEKGIQLEYDGTPTKGTLLNLLFEETVEDHLIQPTIIMDYPCLLYTSPKVAAVTVRVDKPKAPGSVKFHAAVEIRREQS